MSCSGVQGGAVRCSELQWCAGRCGGQCRQWRGASSRRVMPTWWGGREEWSPAGPALGCRGAEVPGCRGAGVPGCWDAGGTWRFHGRLGLPGLGVGDSSLPPGLDCWESAHGVRLFALPKVQVGLWPCYLVMPTIPFFGHRVLRQYLPCNKADS